MKKPVLTVVLIALVAAALVGGWKVWSTRAQATHTTAAPMSSRTVPPPAPAEAPVPAAGAGDERGADGDVPAWAKPAAPGAQSVQPPAAAQPPSPLSAAEEARRRKLEAALQKANAMQGKTDLRPEEAAQMLQEIEEANGSPNLNGLRLDRLRENLVVAGRMKAIAEELQAMQASPDAKSPAAQAAVMAKVKELEALQKKMLSPGEFYTAPSAAMPERKAP